MKKKTKQNKNEGKKKRGGGGDTRGGAFVYIMSFCQQAVVNSSVEAT